MLLSASDYSDRDINVLVATEKLDQFLDYQLIMMTYSLGKYIFIS